MLVRRGAYGSPLLIKNLVLLLPREVERELLPKIAQRLILAVEAQDGFPGAA